ncbi:murein DD-endopeptidase MepM/ murein hydrolase activator NlpD [Methanohalophilus levihalophilus]|uniref:M23 family metallopeptidase n=1 Tax=Methanohalophilus levihalophilus TaxID=1431282 RepID=UPI001AE1E11B|nr:M23 family metallopeptidase [Methanohalophilus levihalophilus]MBP2030241.1 murein DD-endopeptidase MepM/ murein hydrolase activator NlpD [Methanohalophilus levihalophilus]
MKDNKCTLFPDHKVCLPEKGESGSFLEDRKDRIHCGIDIYAPAGTEVLAIEEGIVVDIGIMTSPDILSYWNETHYVIVKTASGMFCKYAELGETSVRIQEEVKEGDLIGKVGMVLNPEKIDETAPLYIQDLKNRNPSMLHFELWNKEPCTSPPDYLGGNWFEEGVPDGLLDPGPYITARMQE